MFDEKGFRLNVGIVLCNADKKLFLGRRRGKKDMWQFPQGGIKAHETLEQAMYRELYEEIGLAPDQVEVIHQTDDWLYYYIPEYLRRQHQKPVCIGQKQKWFLLRLIANDEAICFDRTELPEFTSWKWVDFWEPLQQIVAFKKGVYKKILETFEPFLKPIKK